jgi:hypothetical protein
LLAFEAEGERMSDGSASSAAVPAASANAIKEPNLVMVQSESCEEEVEAPVSKKQRKSKVSKKLSANDDQAGEVDAHATPAENTEASTASNNLAATMLAASSSVSAGKKKADLKAQPLITDLLRAIKKVDSKKVAAQTLKEATILVTVSPGGEAYVVIKKDINDQVINAFGKRFEKRAPKDGIEQVSVTMFTCRKRDSKYADNGYENVLKKEDVLKAGFNSAEPMLRQYQATLAMKKITLKLPDTIPRIRAEINISVSPHGEAQVTGDTIFISMTASMFGEHGCSVLLNYDQKNSMTRGHQFNLRKVPPMWYCPLTNDDIKASVSNLITDLMMDDRLVVNGGSQ